MKTACIQQIEQAIGRALGKGEAQRMEDRITANLRELARTDKTFAGMAAADRLKAAAELSLKQDTEQAAKAAQRKALNASAQARETSNLIARSKEFGGKDAVHKALFERLRQVDQYVTGVRNELFGNLMDAMHAAAPRFMGLIENPTAVRDFVREVYGEKTGNKVAADGAKAYLEQVEHIRERLNSAGADIGKLDYGYLPQPHDTGAIVKAGKAEWVGKVLPRLDRSRYFNPDGSAMTDAQMNDFLSHSYDTLATEGLTRREAGSGGAGSRASRFDEAHRALHFKDPDSYLGYLADFGQGSVFESIHNHVNMQAKNIGLMESFGSNPTSTYKLLNDTAQIEDSRAAGRPAKGVTQYGATTDMVWDVLNGTTASPVNPRAAAIGRTIRNWTSATKLGGVMISSINDAPTWLATARYNGVPLGKAFGQMFKSLASSSLTEDAARLGLAVESVSGEMQAWHADNLRQDWSGKIANATMKLQFVEAWTHRLRAGLGLMLQDQLATLKNTDWGALSDFDRERFKAAGLTDGDWQVWQAATPENIRGRDLLTANAIRNAKGVAPPAAGMVRYYHGGSPEGVTGPLWVTSHLPDAEGWASRGSGMKVWYVDVPANHAARGAGDLAAGIPYPSRVELPADLANQRKPWASGSFTDAQVNQAVAKMLGFIDNEGKTAVLAPDVVTRATITQGMKAGTLGGEIGRSLMLFKSFPLSMVIRNIERIKSIPTVKGRLAYSLSLLTGLTLMGALSVELKDLISGKNPRDATTPKFWGAAFAQGGGLGIFGDMLYTGLGGNSRGGQPNWTSLAGPVAGTAADAANVTLGNLGQVMQGKDPKAAAELLRFARQNVPFMNLWYLKAAIDHAGFNELQDSLSPGYLARQKAAARRDWGTTYWWEPGDSAPTQMADLTTAAGR